MTRGQFEKFRTGQFVSSNIAWDEAWTMDDSVVPLFMEVLAALGIGFWIAQTRFPEDMGEGFFIIGTLVAALGVGFAVSAGLAYVISQRFGLLAPPPVRQHE